MTRTVMLSSAALLVLLAGSALAESPPSKAFQDAFRSLEDGPKESTQTSPLPKTEQVQRQAEKRQPETSVPDRKPDAEGIRGFSDLVTFVQGSLDEARPAPDPSSSEQERDQVHALFAVKPSPPTAPSSGPEAPASPSHPCPDDL